MSTTYSTVTSRTNGTTGTGLDQLVDAIHADNSLAGNNSAAEITSGASAADQLNRIIVEAALATGAAADRVFTAAEVVAMNAWIRANRLVQWTALHGDDETAEETGYHQVQNDGADTNYRGQNLLNTVIDGVYHMGFEIQNGAFLNEDGNANATVEQVAGWLTQFWQDRATTGTGLDRAVALIQADAGLAAGTTQADIAGGQDAANGLNQLIAQGLAATNAASDGSISVADVTALNAWIRADATRLAQFTALHGDDENGEETGYHLVQNDGANTPYFGKNLVNTVLDGIYHIGFQIQGANLLNEDGNANAALTDVASWLNYFYIDQSSTGTGLDRIVDAIKTDAGLARNTTAADINAGAGYANSFNQLIVQAITATNAMGDGWITSEDLRAMNSWVRSDATRLAQFTALHGDDENGEETGYHLVQNDGANTNYFGKNLVNTVADGLYHFGFQIQGNNFLNEDGNANAALSDVGNWLNYFYKGATWINGNDTAETLTGSAAAEEIVARGGNDVVDGGTGNDLIWGGGGNDTIFGGAGDDLVYAGANEDRLDGGLGNDTYRVTGTQAEGWASFEGYDTYVDSAGTDTVQAYGNNVDIGVVGWTGTGVETIDGTRATGTVTVIDNSSANLLDFRTTTLVGGNVRIDGNAGNDTLYGSAGHDTLISGIGNDVIDGGAGNDTYRVTGNQAGGWASFHGYDAYSDTGTSNSSADRLQAIGTGDVDIGVTGWGATGIEVIDGSGATGTTRLVGDGSANVLNFSATTFVGSHFLFNGGAGNDTITGTAGSDVIMGDIGDDKVDGGNGADTYRITGNQAGGWASFHSYDTYADTGTSGVDRLQAVGTGDVDIGMDGWSAANGIEVIDGSGAAGLTRLIGNSSANVLDFSATTFVGSHFLFNGGAGNDTITGTAGNDVIMGDIGDDKVDGGNGSDIYRVTGNQAGGWASFHSYDTYNDTGTSGIDTLQAIGTGDVDIGMAGWSAANGIEVIDLRSVAGTARILGSGNANLLDFRATTLLQNTSGLLVDGSWGNDTVHGSAGADTLIGSYGNDSVDGGLGNDSYVVGRGLGSDRLNDTDATAGNTDTLTFTGGVTADQLWFRHVGNDLEVRIVGTYETTTIANWYSGSAQHIEQIRTSDGKTLRDTQVDSLVSAMAGFAVPAAGQSTLNPTYQAVLLPLISSSWT